MGVVVCSTHAQECGSRRDDRAVRARASRLRRRISPQEEVLTVTGPYGHTRNPLYLGSAILGLGAGVATWSWISAGILAAYFAVVYTVVMRREEGELFQHHGEGFKAYAAAVPLFLPRLNAARISGASTGAFSLAQYKKNHEYQATLGYLLLLIGLLCIWRFRLH